MQRLFEKYSNKFAYVHFLLYPCGEIFVAKFSRFI